MVAGPLSRTLWLIGVPAVAGFWWGAQDRNLLPSALLFGAAAALAPAALFEMALPVVLSHNPGGGAGMVQVFLLGLRALLLVGIAATLAQWLRRLALQSIALPIGPLVALFVAFYAAMIAPRPTLLSETFAPGVGGAGDPLAALTLILPIAPWIAAVALGGIAAVVFHARRVR